MKREQKTALVEEIAGQIKDSEAIFAVDYRGISVPQAAELREKLREAGARFRIVKNTLTERAADDAGAESLKELLDGPTAFTFVTADGGDVALAAKALSQFRRANDVLEFKGGVMGGEPLALEQIEALAKLPARDVLQGQLVGVLASPVTGLVRGLNQLIAGLAIALGQIQAEGKLEANAAPDADGPAADEPAAEEEPAADEAAGSDGDGEAEPPPPEDGPDAGADEGADTPADEAPGDPVAEGEAAAEEAPAGDQEPENDEAPSEGEEEKEG